jgi:murein L,D-transpeptidase YcbB/YkuD
LKRQHLFLLIFAFSVCTSCNNCSKKEPVMAKMEKPEMVNEEIHKLITKQLSGLDTNEVITLAGDSLIATPFIQSFYFNNKFAVNWSDKGELTKPCDTLLSVLAHAEDYGLIPDDYHYSKISKLINGRQDSITKKFDATKLFKADMLLTDAFFKFLVHVSKGRMNADSLTREWHPDLMDTNMVVLLHTAIRNNTIRNVIDSLEPRGVQYKRLKKALNDFRYEFRDVTWDSLASRESDSTTFKERLKQRLIASHDFVADTSISDSMQLIKAIKNFQCRHNLTEDGKIGKLTFKALQRTKLDYIRAIEMNMERLRWKDLPKDERYVFVNIPKYEMRVMEADTLVMRSRVIVGEPDHQTPELKSTIRYFIIYPYWNVPYSIATKELLPILKRDTSYLRRKNFEVLDRNNLVVDPHTINWKRFSKTYFPYKLRQRIGDDNSLGILKFNFENKHGVYMHDTDNRRLFGREMRSLSHGCVRLEKFFDFASFLIREDSVKYPLDSLKSDLLREQQKYVYARKPIPIYIRYYTTEVDEHGGLYFFIDIYRKDEKMKIELYRKKETKKV